jgi:hypothetical protein
MPLTVEMVVTRACAGIERAQKGLTAADRARALGLLTERLDDLAKSS